MEQPTSTIVKLDPFLFNITTHEFINQNPLKPSSFETFNIVPITKSAFEDSKLGKVIKFLQSGGITQSDILLYKPSQRYRNLLEKLFYLANNNIEENFVVKISPLPLRKNTRQEIYGDAIKGFYLNRLRYYNTNEERRKTLREQDLLAPITPCFVRVIDWFKLKTNLPLPLLTSSLRQSSTPKTSFFITGVTPITIGATSTDTTPTSTTSTGASTTTGTTPTTPTTTTSTTSPSHTDFSQVVMMERADIEIIDHFVNLFKQKQFTVERLLAYIAMLLHALEVAWNFYGFVHYDLHTGNVMIKKIIKKQDTRNVMDKIWIFERPNKKHIYIKPFLHQNNIPMIIDFGRSRIQAPFKDAQYYGYTSQKNDVKDNGIPGFTQVFGWHAASLGINPGSVDKPPVGNSFDMRMFAVKFLYNRKMTSNPNVQSLGFFIRNFFKISHNIETRKQIIAFKRIMLKMLGIIGLPGESFIRVMSKSVLTDIRWKPVFTRLMNTLKELNVDKPKILLDERIERAFDSMWVKISPFDFEEMRIFMMKHWVHVDLRKDLQEKTTMNSTQILDDEYFTTKYSKTEFEKSRKNKIIMGRWRHPKDDLRQQFRKNRQKHSQFEPLKCMICGKQANYKCLKCKNNTYYCGEECQKSDWVNHSVNDHYY